MIVSKYAGVAELCLKHDAGLVYDPGNFISLFEILKKVINNPATLKKLVDNGRKLITEEDLSLKIATEKIINLYYEVLA